MTERCTCPECLDLDALPDRLQGWPGAYQLRLLPRLISNEAESNKQKETTSMMINCAGDAVIKHAETGKVYRISAEELDWQQVGGDDRQMGPEFHYEAALAHPQLGDLTWSVWEYPTGVENLRETKVGPHELVSDMKYGLGA